MIHHFLTPQNNASVKEYSSEIEKWIDVQHDQYSGVIRAIGILEKEIWSLSAQNEGLDGEIRQKNNDILVKLFNCLLNHRSKLMDIEKAQEPVTLIFNQLQVIVQEELKSIKSKEGRAAITNIFTRLNDSCGNIVIDQ